MGHGRRSRVHGARSRGPADLAKVTDIPGWGGRPARPPPPAPVCEPLGPPRPPLGPLHPTLDPRPPRPSDPVRLTAPIPTKPTGTWETQLSRWTDMAAMHHPAPSLKPKTLIPRPDP